MRIATITDAKNRLSALLDLVRSGESVLIVDRGKPIARIDPAASIDEDPTGRLTRLERAGVVRIGRNPPDRALMRTKPPRAKGGSALKALLDERLETR